MYDIPDAYVAQNIMSLEDLLKICKQPADLSKYPKIDLPKREHVEVIEDEI